MIRLTIITTTIRPDGALRAARSVQAAACAGVELRHVIAYWPGEIVLERVTQERADWITRIIGEIDDGWLMLVDDDNLLHPELPRRMAELLAEHPHAGAIVFDSVYPEVAHGLLRAGPDRVKPTYIDGGQVVLRHDVAKLAPWGTERISDGTYLYQVYEQARDSFIFVNEPLCYHNAQVWKNESEPYS